MFPQSFRALALVGLLFLVMPLLLQAASPIAVKSVTRDRDGVTLQMEPGVLRLQVCTDRMVRVVYSPTASLPKLEDYVVIAKWTPVPFAVADTAAMVTLSTGKLQVQVNKRSGAVAFLDPAGRILLQEPMAGGKKLTSVVVNHEQTWQVEQTFQCPPDESLFGMGQYQDGIWNWRGIPLEMRQQNTIITVPMLISSKGYGLLWDNAALTQFNPVDTEVTLPEVAAQNDANMPKATEDLAKTPQKAPTKSGDRSGEFTTTVAGDYVFFAKDGDRSKEITILVDGKEVAGVKNIWVPYSISGKISLPAETKVQVTLRGGGKDAKVYGRPLGDSTVFRSEVGDAIDYSFFYGPGLDTVVSGYRVATGAAPLWPRWAYGFWQCRERYSNQQQILDTVAEFRKRQIPADLIVQDWQYWGHYGWGAYQWDEKNYPDPTALLDGVHDQHFKFMISIWPNPKGPVHEALKAGNGLLGSTDVYDAYNPKARALRWSFLNDAFYKIGVDAWWQDAAEPMDDGNGVNDQQTFLGSGNRVRNAYPLFHNQTAYEGQRVSDPSKRVCILTRSSYPGEQRYGAAAWSGDINSNWDAFKRQIPAGLNFCLTGLPYWTTDCGGFFRPGGGQYQSGDYNELLTRWFQWSTFCPILRVHGYQTTTEMWNYLPQTQKNLLAYDQLRYRMLPYNYSVAWLVTSKGYTIMRALPLDFRNDAKALTLSDEYMFGPAFLVSPVTEPQATSRRVYLPAGTRWINFWTGETAAGGQEMTVPAPLETLPLFVRAGSIVPLGPVVQYAGEKLDAPIELRIYPGADGTFTLYEDEGDNYNYEHGAYTTIPIRWDEKKQALTIGARVGTFPGMVPERIFRVIRVSSGHGTGLAADEKTGIEVHYNGKSTQVSL